jgi:hypothetical protein
LPETGFTELFTRYAKTMVQVGDAPADMPDGLSFRFDLQPLTPPDQSGATFRLIWQGEPLAGHPVSVLVPGDAKRIVISGPDGHVQIDDPGSDTYLVNSVFMEPLDTGTEAVWHSHWASFYVETKTSQSQQIRNAAHK